LLQFFWSPSCHRSASANVTTMVSSIAVQNHYKEQKQTEKVSLNSQ
jgi:hypothetical protein